MACAQRSVIAYRKSNTTEKTLSRLIDKLEDISRVEEPLSPYLNLWMKAAEVVVKSVPCTRLLLQKL